MLLNGNANCTVGAVMFTVAGNVSGVRMNQICTLCLAIDRLYALFKPIAYRTKNHLRIAQIVIFISFVWSAAEIVGNVFSQDLGATKSSCTSSAAFPDGYRIYRVLSSLILNVGTQILYAVVFFKIRKLSNNQITQDSRDKMQQANTTISIVFGTSLLFMVLPSIWNVYSFFSVSVTLGPIMSLFPCLNGAVNVFIYGWKHRDFKAATKAVFCRSKNQVRSSTGQKPIIYQGVVPLQNLRNTTI